MPLIQRQQSITVELRVRSDQEIDKQAARSVIALLAASSGMRLKRSSSRPPDRFIQIPFDGNAIFAQERIHKIFGAAGSGNQLGEYRCSHDQASTAKCRFEGGLSGSAYRRVILPQGNDNVGIDGRRHADGLDCGKQRLESCV